MPSLLLNLPRLIKDNESNTAKARALSRASQSDTVKVEFGRRVIDEIIRRTQEDNVDKNGKNFKSYSKAYKKSVDFEIYGKSKDVNMTLTGAMLSNMSVKGVTSNTVKIGFISETQNLKAEGHTKGTGHLPKRDFFGLPDKDSYSILKKTIRDVVGNAAFETIPSRGALTGRVGG